MPTRKVEATVEIQSPPEQVILAFMDSTMLRDWWGVERCLIEKKIGGVYSLVWGLSDRGMKYISSGTIKTLDPEGLLEVEDFLYFNPEKPIFGPMSLKIQARRKGTKTNVYLCQAGYQEGAEWDWYFEAVRNAWPIALKTLKTYLESKPLP